MRTIVDLIFEFISKLRFFFTSETVGFVASGSRRHESTWEICSLDEFTGCDLLA